MRGLTDPRTWGGRLEDALPLKPPTLREVIEVQPGPECPVCGVLTVIVVTDGPGGEEEYDRCTSPRCGWEGE